MLKIKELPIDERPREKLLAQGADVLASAELLAILIGSGSRKESALYLASRVLALLPDGIGSLAGITEKELMSISGIGEASAARILAAIELGKRAVSAPAKKRPCIFSPEDAALLYQAKLRGQKQELFHAILLDQKGAYMADVLLAKGSATSVSIDPCTAFRPALARGAKSVILVHNHPSGNPKPSNEDISLTKRFIKAGEILGIAVLDHIIIAGAEWTSLKRIGAGF